MKTAKSMAGQDSNMGELPGANDPLDDFELSPRVRIIDIMRITGLSRATVDRVVNRRGGIHPRTVRLVRDAYMQLRAEARTAEEDVDEVSSHRPQQVDAVIRFGRGLTEQIFSVRERYQLPLKLHDMHERTDEEILKLVKDLCRTTDHPLVVGLKNSEAINNELLLARANGKRVITLVSDLSFDVRDTFVGIDNRRAGQAAAFIVGQGLKGKPAKVAVVLGDNAFRCHEDREIGFRTYLRATFPNIELTDVVKGDDSIKQTHEAVLGLVTEHPDIDAIYNLGGGNIGLAEALEQAGLAGRIVVVTHETNSITLPLIQKGVLSYLIGQDVPALLDKTMHVAMSVGHIETTFNFLNFGIYTPFNIPHLDDLVRLSGEKERIEAPC